jgi:hypothetical protein
MNRLTVGLATYRDFDGAYFTLQSLRAHHGNGFDILVLDNAPERCVRTEQVTRAVGGRYIHRPDLTGTSKPRDAIFHLSETPWVMVCDSHVLFEPGAIAKLIELSGASGSCKDFFTGPLVWDDGVGVSTHWRSTTPPGLWGVWDRDDRADGVEPFAVPMQGLGCFAMARDAWPGFHPLSRGFGGEEGYIHEKVRKSGGRVLCVPRLRWRHRFRDVGGWDKNPTPYPAYLGDHTFNLLVQHRELGIEAEGAILKDFGARLTAQEWDNVLKEARESQLFGEPAKQPVRQQIVGVWYTDNTAPPALLQASLKSIAEAKRQTWRHEVVIVACGWEVPEEPVPGVEFVRFTGERKRSHATIIAQIREALSSLSTLNSQLSTCEAVCFLEHDVLYPEWYFQRIGDTFANNPTSPVVSNLDYIGLSAQGWQPVRERHEPMHQLSMRYSFALENLQRAAKEAESGSALLEPQGDRSNWVRLPPTPGLGLAPAVHVNHTAGRFTSHGEVVYAPAAATIHPHWGEHRNWWPGGASLRDAGASNQGQGASGGCGCGKPGAEHPSIEKWYEVARTNPSDFHEHVVTIKELADKCEVVSEVAMWGKPSLVALCASNAKAVHSYSPIEKGEWHKLKELENDRLQTRKLDPSQEVEPTDLLFVDTHHTAQTVFDQLNANKDAVRKYMAVHTTETFGEKGDDGSPGVLVGIRKFVHENREWTVIRHDRNNHGLIVLSRLDEDRKTPPGLLRKALNFSKALAEHAKAGMRLVEDTVYETRLELCLLCPERAHDTCSKCGCPVDKKCSWAEQQCPADPPKWLTSLAVES